MMLAEKIAEMDHTADLYAARNEGIEIGLHATVSILKMCGFSFDEAYKKIVAQPEYKNVSEDTVKNIYYSL